MEIQQQIDTLSYAITKSKNYIQFCRQKYMETQDPKYKCVEEYKQEMVVKRMYSERYSRESEALCAFLKEMTDVISYILNSSFVFTCSEVTLLTIFNVLSVYFYSLENHEVMGHYEEHIYSFIKE